MPVRTYSEPKVKNKAAITREYGWTKVTDVIWTEDLEAIAEELC